MSTRRDGPNPRLAIAAVLLVVLIFFSRSIFSLMIDLAWWRELGQVSTWLRMAVYRYLPGIVAWIIAFIPLWIVHARAVKFAGTGLGAHRIYALLSTLALLILSLIVSTATVDGWTIARFVGGSGIESTWHDPVFGRGLSFYFFELPFYAMLIHFIAGCAFLAALIYYVTARGWQIATRFSALGAPSEIDLRDLRMLGKVDTVLFRVLIVILLVSMAAEFWLGRYRMLTSDHGNLMAGIDYLQQTLGLPLQAAKAVAALLAAVLVLAGRRLLAAACAVVLIVDIALPPIVGSLHVRPNELSLERPYLERHIEATRAAYALDRRATTVDFPATKDSRIDFVRNKPLLDNVRLWDWSAFHDTLSQSQPLRPYTYADTDVDRYLIDGKLRQVLLSPREIDLNQLGDARHRWINHALTFTHGYGLVLAEANRITTTGLPELLIKSAPIEVLTPSLKIGRAEIYYGETLHDPVFVHTSQPEFNYPASGGSGEVNTTYSGTGGFPISSFGMRFMAAFSEWEWNILLTNSLTADSRMMIRRRLSDRLKELAGFISWDKDAYLVISDSGALTWMVDGYLTSDAHPYSRPVSVEGMGSFNYIRNSVKATIDAYNGTVNLYVFDPTDPLINAFSKLFPDLFKPASAMPADLRKHTRAPEVLFSVQAEIYRTYHMREPELYYNRADLWDIATKGGGATDKPATVTPTYLLATLPGATEPEFLLTLPFTPRNKQNLIGIMVARCDAEHLGELVFLELPKQEVIQGPLQIEALINQDQTISKDLTLWNQQGSQVLRSQILTLPIDNTILYVAPIYLQAAQARMPQLKKVALAVGTTLVYADTYDQALADLDAALKGQPVSTARSTETPSTTTAVPATSTPPPVGSDARVESIRSHFKRYRDLMAQGKWSEAGKELEAVEALLKK
ncbi:MAG TPA: UPF0182 family protein [Bryobacteraceae bacterium]|nr:UPF0182 family protein [Bryobacteraceae bacterium]